MLHLKNHNAYFVHVLKTGGTWVRHVMKKMGLSLEEIGKKHTYCQKTLENADSVFSVYRGYRTWSESFWLMKQRGARQTHGKPTYLHTYKRHGVPKCWPTRLDTLADRPLPQYRDEIFEDYNFLMEHYRRAGTVENHKQGSYELLVGDLAQWLNSLGIDITVEELNKFPPINTRLGV